MVLLGCFVFSGFFRVDMLLDAAENRESAFPRFRTLPLPASTRLLWLLSVPATQASDVGSRVNSLTPWGTAA